MESIIELGREFGVGVAVLGSVLAAFLWAAWKAGRWIGDRLLGEAGILTNLAAAHLEALREFRLSVAALTDVCRTTLAEVEDINRTLSTVSICPLDPRPPAPPPE